MTGLRLEPLTSTNAAATCELLADVDGAYFEHTTPEAVQRFLSEPQDVHLVAWTGDRPVAFGMLRGWQRGFEIPSLGLAVRRSEEGRGFGRAMVEALEGRAKERGASQIRLRVHAANVRAHRLYRGCGYRDVGTERGQILMTRQL